MSVNSKHKNDEKGVRSMKPRAIKSARTELGYTQAYMANVLGICVDSYSKKERGKTAFSDEEKLLLVRTLNLSIQQFNKIFYNGELPIA